MEQITAAQVQKYKGKSISQLISIAEKHFNAYIRQRDAENEYFRCISCGIYKPTHQMNAGHYMSAGHNAAVRFSEDNVHGQCVRCNLHMHGNLIPYRANLVEKIGEEKVLLLESSARLVHKWDRFGLIYVIETYKSKLK